MDGQPDTELLRIIWKLNGQRDYPTADGEQVTVSYTGEYDPHTGHFTGAEISAGKTVYRGEVALWAGNPPAAASTENCVAQITPRPCARMLKHDGMPLIQIIVEPDPLCAAAYESLREGAGLYKCTGHLARMEDHERIALFTRLLADRLNRKCGDLRRIYQECEQNWNETMYVMLLRTMGDNKNKEAFTELARRVRYSYLARERNTLQYVEALLLGASGLLGTYEDDTYIRDLKSDFDYLRRKYSIVPMETGAWMLNTRLNNHPVLRIAQLSSFLAVREFIFENLILCRSVEDLHNFFRAEASQYWSTHYTPESLSSQFPKRIGHMKADLLGINLAVPMIFAYGNHMADEGLKERALELLEKINAESNKITDAWRAGGTVMESAFDSQAVLELNNEYCLKSRCWQCPVGKRVIKEVHRRASR